MSSISNKRTRALLGSAASTLVLGAMLSAGMISPAMAQDQAKAAAAAADAAEGVEVEKVVVTGTFLRGPSETAAIPVESIGLEEMRDRGSPSNLDLIKGLSEVGSVAGEANRNNGFALGAQSINLRSLSSSRTVVVFNGRRFPEQYSFTVGRFNNIAQIPNAAIGQVSILKDGGATTYGADAIGGVVNYITRRNLNGVEVNASYTFIDDSDGDYDASIAFGRRLDDNNFNFMGILGYIHRSELDLTSRDWALKPYLFNPASWNGAGSPGAYAFQTSTANAALNVVTPFGTGNNRYTGNLQMSITGVMRDPACTALGGFAGWSATPSPLCYQQTGPRQNLVDETTTWQAYGEANYELSDKFRIHGEYAYYGLDIPHVPIDNGGGLINNFPLARDPVTGALLSTTLGCPTGVSSCAYTQGYGTPAAGTAAGTAAYFVPGANPAVDPFLRTFKNSSALGGGNALSDAQIAAIVSSGRVVLPLGTWRPFGAGGNPQYDFQHNFSTQNRYTLEVSGDIGKFAGAKWDWSFAYTLNTLDYTLAFYDIPVDRLQAALNGKGGNNCAPGAAAGSTGCLWFNPFSSAVKENVYTHAQNNVTYNASVGNSQELIDWLYVPQSMLRRSDYKIFDFLMHADFDYHLWSDEGITAAIGAQYRELNETSDLTDLGDEFQNPCATIGVQVCTTRQGTLVFRRDANVSGFVRDYDRQYPVEAAFGEIKLPITEDFSLNLSTRWEKFFSDLGGKDNQVVVSQAAARWQVTPWMALRGTAGQTFSNANPPAPNAANTNTANNVPAEYCSPTTGCGGATYTTANYSNTAVAPETGFNWNAGAIFQAGPFRATVDYYNIKIDGWLVALTAANVLRASTVSGPTGELTYFNCSSPLIAQNNDLMEGKPFVQLNGDGSCVQGVSTVKANLARVNFFGSQGQQTALYNGPTVQTTGLDFSARYIQPGVFGGDLTLEGDASYVLTYDVGDFQVGGFTVTPGYDAVGYINNGIVAQRINPWRGSVTANFRKGRHNFNWSTRFQASVVNTDDTLLTAQAAYNANIGDANGPAFCTGALVSAPVPPNAGTGLYGPNTNAVGPVGFASCQNVSVINGSKVPSSLYSDFTYRLQLPENTNMALTIANVFDRDPSFSRDIINYDAYSGSPLGRTYKVSVSKKW